MALVQWCNGLFIFLLRVSSSEKTGPVGMRGEQFHVNAPKCHTTNRIYLKNISTYHKDCLDTFIS